MTFRLRGPGSGGRGSGDEEENRTDGNDETSRGGKKEGREGTLS